MKFWRTRDEWYHYAPCFGIADFTLPPSREDAGPVADPAVVQSFCSGCRVRPECATAAYWEQWNAVWSCGTWIPSHDEGRREAGAVRQNLLDSVAGELDRRGDDV